MFQFLLHFLMLAHVCSFIMYKSHFCRRIHWYTGMTFDPKVWQLQPSQKCSIFIYIWVEEKTSQFSILHPRCQSQMTNPHLFQTACMSSFRWGKFALHTVHINTHLYYFCVRTGWHTCVPTRPLIIFVSISSPFFFAHVKLTSKWPIGYSK